ncbi:uncharacterized protein LOC125940184 [Dermacentor silvarum]|uniref:uncharacterized protein LOC125940184 n=1 Tax=Dermacentor silvarum TaxID=543639 RepID=UPI002100852F|nr:uncharacterized protein LOC125940184 [Dermacentor silvarum]
MELLREFGDPKDLLLAQDHIMLKLETAWPPDVTVPGGLSFADHDSLLLIANQTSLVSAAKSSLLREAIIPKALFCGCAPFDSSDRYASAARQLLRHAQEICILHNRDKVYKLIRMFPNVKVLCLPHDLCLHLLELDEPCRDRSAPLVERCQLRELVGNIGSLCKGLLGMSPETTLAVIRTCPDLRRIDSWWAVKCYVGPYGLATSSAHRRARKLTHLWLGLLDNMSGGRAEDPMNPMTAVDVPLAARIFSSVQSLQVVVESLDTLAKISAFCNLRSLTVELNPCIALADVDSELQHALRRLSRLEELALENCGGLRLSTISRLCPKLKILKLEGCVVSAEDTLVDGDAFPNLEYIDVNINILKVAWNAFLSATHDTLRTARFVHDSMCFEFLQYCVRYGRHQPFSRLEHLTLNTNMSLRESEVHPEDLHDVMKALPVLRHLETDSYDLRLFMENYCVPRGRLSLSWIECVYCAVHRPDLALFEKMLASAMGSLVYRQ